MLDTFIWIIHRGSSAPSHFAEDIQTVVCKICIMQNWISLCLRTEAQLWTRPAGQPSKFADSQGATSEVQQFSALKRKIQAEISFTDFHYILPSLIFWDLLRSFEIFVPLCKTKRSTDARWQPTGALWGPCLATCKATHVAGIYRPSLDCKRLDFLKFTSWMKSSITIITKHSRTQCNVFISKSQNNRCPYSKKTKPSWLFSWLISFISQPRWEFLLWPWHGCTPSAKCLTKCICYGFQCSSKTCNYW